MSKGLSGVKCPWCNGTGVWDKYKAVPCQKSDFYSSGTVEGCPSGDVLDLPNLSRPTTVGHPSSITGKPRKANYSSGTVEKRCTCGEPHISDRFTHCYDGTPCYVTDSVPIQNKDGKPDKIEVEDDD